MTTGQLTGLAGTYLVAAELALRGLNPVVTSRNMKGTDILVEDSASGKLVSIQVKANRRTFGYWLLGSPSSETGNWRNRFCALVNIKPKEIEYYIVPAHIVKEKRKRQVRKRSVWYWVERSDVALYKDRWDLIAGSVLE